MNPLDLPGPDFLVLYGFLMALAIGLAIVIRFALTDRARGIAAGSAAALQWMDLAYLAGGPQRAFDAAVAALLAAGAVRFEAAAGGVVVISPAPPVPPILQAVRERLAPRTTHQRLVRTATPVFSGIRDGLVARGLMFDQALGLKIAIASALPPVAVTLFGLVKIAVGMSRGRPVGGLVVLAVVMAGVAVLLVVKRPTVTMAGKTVLREQKQENARIIRAPLEGEMPLAVALAGTAILAGTPHAAYAKYAAPSDSSSDGGSGGGDGGGGGGCGGCSP